MPGYEEVKGDGTHSPNDGRVIWNAQHEEAFGRLDDLEDHPADTTDAHDASAISVADVGGNFSGTDVESVLTEIQGTLVSGGTPDATETVKGKLELASQAETNTGTDDTRGLTPLKLATYIGLRHNTFESVASQAAMLALSAKKGDIAKRTDLNPDTSYRLTAEPASTPSNWTPIGVLESGVSDHGALSGLGDDDHTQYHNNARGDARYYTQTQLDASLAGKASTGSVTTVQTNLDNHTNDTSDAHDASSISFSPTGSVAATDVQGAIAEVASEGGGGSAYTPSWVGQSTGAIFSNYGDGNPALAYEAFRISSSFIGSSGLGTSTMRLVRFRLPKALAMTNVRALAEGNQTNNVTFGIYNASTGSKVWDSGTFSTSTGTWVNLIASLPSLSANTDYWFAITFTGGSTANVFRTPVSPGSASFWGSSQNGPLAGKSIGIPEVAQAAVTSGAMPSTLPTLVGVAGSSSTAPFVWLEGTAS
jgi:hypothetical protein